MKDKLSEMLNEKRFRHSLGVCELSCELARRFGADVEKAYIAGLLHDCAKNIDNNRALKMCGEYGIELNEIELKNPALIHAPLGAEIVKREFGINDEEIYLAIKNHTVGRYGMGLLEKIIYIADMAEQTRDFPGVELIRKQLEKNLDEAVLTGLKFSMELNLKRGNLIHEDTIKAWNSIIMSKESD